ncbi:hypothetical protein COLO4_08317 [Corchorus olitorius]|uniref:Protein phosphatase n=1 Tax=Corchorus olitorius TaxID=93759 RepID=A0A1R3KGD6_9ROSI|nr:hypothetical protein COLO4_08317 [Corchorus olitorius]
MSLLAYLANDEDLVISGGMGHGIETNLYARFKCDSVKIGMAFAGGEDAYYIASKNCLEVADGAGQWSPEGTYVGLCAKELMKNCEKIVSDRNGVPITDPLEVLNRSAANTQSCDSSTVLVAYFDDRAWELIVNWLRSYQILMEQKESNVSGLCTLVG